VLRAAEQPAVGIGFRKEIAHETLAAARDLDVIEITVDHYIYGSDPVRECILEACSTVPAVVHGVGLSLGTAIQPDAAYLDRVAEFIELVGAPWYSEHLAYTKVPGLDLAQLVPLPRTTEMMEVLRENINTVVQHVRVPMVLENIAYYFDYRGAEYDEVTFLNEITKETNSYLLLDLENLRINSTNHGFDAGEFIQGLRSGVVKAVHLAGGDVLEGIQIDSHDRSVPEQTLTLLPSVLAKHRVDSIIVERDQNLDDVESLLADVRRVRTLLKQTADNVRKA
jgi:uncharacterized protein